MTDRDDREPTGGQIAPGRRRPYTVKVSEAIEYQGWIMATDIDDADNQARRLLDDGGSATGRGHLDIVRFDCEVMANDAAEVCWQCGTSLPGSRQAQVPGCIRRRESLDRHVRAGTGSESSAARCERRSARETRISQAT